jgi:hypothetical protein
MKAVLKIRQATENNRYDKATFTDSKGKEAKELIQTFWDSDPGKLLIEFEKQVLKLGARYELFKEGRWKVLGQVGGRSLGGRIKRYWSDIVEGATNHATGNSAAQQAKFKKLIQKVNMKYLGKDAADDHKIAMQRGELRYDDQDHDKVAERLFEINRDLELLGKDVEKFTIREMAKLIIPENLKPQAKLKHINKGGKNLRNKEEIIDLCRDIKEVLDIEHGQRQKGSRGSSQTQPSTEER